MKKTRQRKRNRKRSLLKPGMILLVGIAILLLVMKVFQIGLFSNRYQEIEGEKVDAYRPDIQVELLTPNKYSRPQTKTERINNIVIHFIVGLNGEIIQCIPTWEMAYASNNRNQDTVSIECCHPNESGRFNWKTYRSMVELSAWLCLKFGLTEENLIRHYDVTGKNCPKYFVEHPEKWNEFRSDVGKSLEKMK